MRPIRAGNRKEVKSRLNPHPIDLITHLNLSFCHGFGFLVHLFPVLFCFFLMCHVSFYISYHLDCMYSFTCPSLVFPPCDFPTLFVSLFVSKCPKLYYKSHIFLT